MVTRIKQGEFHTTRPGAYKIEPLRMPKPYGRAYTKAEQEKVDRIKKLDAKQRTLATSIKDNENLFRQRFYVDPVAKITRPGVMVSGTKQHKEISELYNKIDSLANSFSVATHDKEIQIRSLEQWIQSNNMELKKKSGKEQ